MKLSVRKNRKILLLIGLLSVFYVYPYIYRHIEASFTEEDFSAFSEMKNIFESILKTIYEKHSDCNDMRLLFKPSTNLRNWESFVSCGDKNFIIYINDYSSKIENILLKYKIKWIITQVDSNKEFEEILFYKNMSIIYALNIYTATECSVKVIENITALPDETINVCKTYCQKLKYKNWYLCKIIEEDNSIF